MDVDCSITNKVRNGRNTEEHVRRTADIDIIAARRRLSGGRRKSRITRGPGPGDDRVSLGLDRSLLA